MYSVEKFILVVGIWFFWFDYILFNGDMVIDSDEILELKILFCILVVIGVGVIGIEYVIIFSVFDVWVILIDLSVLIFSFVDCELIGEFIYDLRDCGMVFCLGD